MRLHRFYLSTSISEETFDIADRDLIHQWRTVFRYNVGSQVILFDGSGVDYTCIISSLRNLGATLSVVEKKEVSFKPKRNIWLCMALIKKDNFELVVQKATELGVSHIVPVLCERSEKKNINMDRLYKIAVEASEQSGRGDIPVIYEVTTVSDALEETSMPVKKILLNFDGKPLTLDNFDDLAILIGPEGGWSERELKVFTGNNVSSASLGTQVLRAETAAIAVSSLLLL
ncbi:16S rRNA (uracil(1498)-N(3))-methyltransferase [Patescibacteria group bacterium]|nr:16S rRNA (uracil(1498)-N(3))-methyltransferase [Patescibacteria group bacterium]